MNAQQRDEIAERAARGAVAYEDLVEHPTVAQPRPLALYIYDQRGPKLRVSLRAWGVGILVASVVGWLVLSGGRSIEGASNWMVAATVLGIAAVLIVRGGPKGRRESIPLAWVDGAMRVLRVREHPEQREITESASIDFDEIDEVLFALRKVALPHARAEARVEGAGVFVRLLDGTVWPVIPATMAKQEAYSIAAGLATRLGVGVKQVGAGWAAA